MKYRLSAIAFALCLLLASSALAADVGTAICFPEFMANADESGKPHLLYKGRTSVNVNMRSEPDMSSASLGALSEGKIVSVFGFDQYWMYCWDEEIGIYYIARHLVNIEEKLDPDAPAYGVTPNRFIAVTSKDTALLNAPNADAEVVFEYPADTRLSFWHIEDGWAVVPYRRQVCYMYVGDLKELTPIVPDVEYAQDGDVISAFTSFYSTAETELNSGRMENMRVGSMYISKSYEAGETLDFNNTAGPYRKSRGYKDAPVLINGETVPGSGGGTCQISTTLYNTILQLNNLTVLYRRPHGPGGASYAPHGVDAAVGNETLNLIFRNDYDFPITIDATVQNGALCICIRKGVWTSAQ